MLCNILALSPRRQLLEFCLVMASPTQHRGKAHRAGIFEDTSRPLSSGVGKPPAANIDLQVPAKNELSASARSGRAPGGGSTNLSSVLSAIVRVVRSVFCSATVLSPAADGGPPRLVIVPGEHGAVSSGNARG